MISNKYIFSIFILNFKKYLINKLQKFTLKLQLGDIFYFNFFFEVPSSDKFKKYLKKIEDSYFLEYYNNEFFIWGN